MTAPFVKYDYILRELAASMDLNEDKILNDPREAALQAEMLGAMQQSMASSPEGAPPTQDPTGNGGGVIAPGNAPEPGAAGFTGQGGGDNGGNVPPPPPEGAPV